MRRMLVLMGFAALLGSAALAAAGPATAAVLRGEVAGSPYASGRASVAVPLLLANASARRAKLRSPVVLALLPRGMRVRVPGRAPAVAPLALRLGDTVRLTVTLTRRTRRAVYPRLSVHRGKLRGHAALKRAVQPRAGDAARQNAGGPEGARRARRAAADRERRPARAALRADRSGARRPDRAAGRVRRHEGRDRLARRRARRREGGPRGAHRGAQIGRRRPADDADRRARPHRDAGGAGRRAADERRRRHRRAGRRARRRRTARRDARRAGDRPGRGAGADGRARGARPGGGARAAGDGRRPDRRADRHAGRPRRADGRGGDDRDRPGRRLDQRRHAHDDGPHRPRQPRHENSRT